MPNPGLRTPNAGSSSFRSGFIAVVGRPNVGKSTLVNRLVGQKVAITAPVPQTTRTRLHGVVTLPQAQLILVDTPGLHAPKHKLGERMVAIAEKALHDADAMLWLVDAAEGVTEEDEAVAEVLRNTARPIVVAVNKTDRTGGAQVAAVEAQVGGLGRFRGIIPISATTGTNLDRLLDVLVELLPEGPMYYPPEMITDQPEQFLVRELIREQAILLTRQEVPHGIAVEIDEFAPREGKELVYIRATLHVERDPHKKMLVGRDGRMLKEIGRRARREVEALLGNRVYLDLWVKTSEKWRQREDLIQTLYPEQL